jgi:hypothetical protein
MTKIDQVKMSLAVYAETNNIPEQAVNLMETLIVNNVSYDDADNFCTEHFITSTVADYYKNFYEYYLAEQTKGEKAPEASVNSNDIKTMLQEIKDKLDFIINTL